MLILRNVTGGVASVRGEKNTASVRWHQVVSVEMWNARPDYGNKDAREQPVGMSSKASPSTV